MALLVFLLHGVPIAPGTRTCRRPDVQHWDLTTELAKAKEWITSLEIENALLKEENERLKKDENKRLKSFAGAIAKSVAEACFDGVGD